MEQRELEGVELGAMEPREVLKTAEQPVEDVKTVEQSVEDVKTVEQSGEFAKAAEELCEGAKASADVAKVADDVAKVADDVAKVAEESADVAKVADDVAKVADDVAKVAEESADVAKVADDVAKVADDVAKVADDVAKVAEESADVAEAAEKELCEVATATEEPCDVAKAAEELCEVPKAADDCSVVLKTAEEPGAEGIKTVDEPNEIVQTADEPSESLKTVKEDIEMVSADPETAESRDLVEPVVAAEPERVQVASNEKLEDAKRIADDQQLESVKRVMEVTGLGSDEAKQLLQMHKNNIDRAIEYHLDGLMAQETQEAGVVAARIEDNGSVSAVAAAAASASLPDDNVRSPIPAQFDQLVTAENDNFRMWRRRAPSQAVVPLRNFAREAALQEEALTRFFDATSSSNGRNEPTSEHGGEAAAAAVDAVAEGAAALSAVSSVLGGSAGGSRAVCLKRSRLEDLFRPPVELMSPGTVYEVRDHATRQQRWLLTNLQNNVEFQSQILNRDVWSHAQLKKIIKKHFVFWQASIDSLEGSKFQCFYHVESTPYVGLLDPRTGEQKKVLNVTTPTALVHDLEAFLKENGTRLDGSDDEGIVEGSSSHPSIGKTIFQTSTAELSEAQQMELAIKNSLAEIVVHDSDSEEDDDDKSDAYTKRRRLEKDVIVLSSESDGGSDDNDNGGGDEAEVDNDDDCLSETDTDHRDRYKSWLGKEQDDMTSLQLRLPDGKSIKLNWPSTSQLKALKLFVEDTYPEHTKEPYKVLSTCPRRSILSLDLLFTLKEAGLHPRSVLHLHPDD